MASSPALEPSAWQLRFGGKKNAPAAKPSQQPKSSSPTIADQLLTSMALRAKPRGPDQIISRECAEELLGRANAFIPQLRSGGAAQRRQPTVEGSEMAQGGGENPEDDGDLASAARKIIQLRFQVDNQAETLRASNTKQSKPMRSSLAATRRQAESKVQQQQWNESKAPALQARGALTGTNRKTASFESKRADQQRTRPEMKPSTSLRDQPPLVARSKLYSHSKAAAKMNSPLEKMDERQRRLKQMQAARKLQQAIAITTEDNQHEATARESSSKRVRSRDIRTVEAKIERLVVENQQATALGDRLRQKQELVQTQRRVFSVWRRLLDQRVQMEAKANEVFRWRCLSVHCSAWRQAARNSLHERIAQATRQRLAQEQQQFARADALYRQKTLPKLFYKWQQIAGARKEQKQQEEGALRRKQQTQRLMERFIRQHEQPPPMADDDVHHERDDHQEAAGTDAHSNPPSTSPASKAAGDRDRMQPTVKPTAPIKQTAWSESSNNQVDDGGSSSKASSPVSQASETSKRKQTAQRTAAPVDPVYLAMEARTAERKQRRALLKDKYDQQEQAKRELVERQLAEREQQLQQQKLDERERIRERKREQALLIQEQTLRLEKLQAQRRRARDHDRLRLLWHYALRPWLQHHELAQRVQANAVLWHSTRVLYESWLTWQRFLRARARDRQAKERVKWEIATTHYNQRLIQTTMAHMRTFHCEMAAKECAIRRQSQWYASHSAWLLWRRALASRRAQQGRLEHEAEKAMAAFRLRQHWMLWRRVVAGWKRERIAQLEKQQLWTKVRAWLDE